MKKIINIFVIIAFVFVISSCEYSLDIQKYFMNKAYFLYNYGYINIDENLENDNNEINKKLTLIFCIDNSKGEFDKNWEYNIKNIKFDGDKIESLGFNVKKIDSYKKFDFYEINLKYKVGDIGNVGDEPYLIENIILNNNDKFKFNIGKLYFIKSKENRNDLILNTKTTIGMSNTMKIYDAKFTNGTNSSIEINKIDIKKYEDDSPEITLSDFKNTEKFDNTTSFKLSSKQILNMKIDFSNLHYDVFYVSPFIEYSINGTDHKYNLSNSVFGLYMDKSRMIEIYNKIKKTDIKITDK